MWTTLVRYYANVRHEDFAKELAEQTEVILLVDSGDRSIQGFSTLRRIEDARSTTILSGDTILESAYWGQRALHRCFLGVVLREKLKHPLRPVYWFLGAKSYKTYLLLARNFPRHWPRHDRPTPPRVRALMDSVATRVFGKAYDSGRGVLARGGSRLSEGVAPLTPELLSAPDVAFFTEQNPGHARGEELCCVGRVSLLLPLVFQARLISGWLERSRLAARRVLAVAVAGLFG
jgi:hypothetical protein